MRSVAPRRVWPAALLLLAVSALAPTAARAQAWLPDPGRGSLYVGYQYAQAHWTLLAFDATGYSNGQYPGGPGKKIFEGNHYSRSETVDLDYGVRQGLAVTAHVGYVASRYTGAARHGLQSIGDEVVQVDDGSYHRTFQDAEVGVHQTVLRTPFVATPFVAYLFPLSPYATRGHAAAGHHLRELRIGAALGRTLSPFLPDAYGLLTYAYNSAEHQTDHSIHRNSLDMELGYFVTPRLSLKGAASWMRTSGGIAWDRLGQEFRQYVRSHDALAEERSWRVGGGASYVLTPRYSLYLVAFTTVSGSSTHAMNTFATGVGWNFAAPWSR